MAVCLEDVLQARGLIQGVVAPTPVLPDPLASEDLGVRLFVKAESLQKSGSFKVRG
ncbi:MAG: pyridoxal-phosphate dependent enzyme, partial [Meiothermus sp.]